MFIFKKFETIIFITKKNNTFSKNVSNLNSFKNQYFYMISQINKKIIRYFIFLNSLFFITNQFSFFEFRSKPDGIGIKLYNNLYNIFL